MLAEGRVSLPKNFTELMQSKEDLDSAINELLSQFEQTHNVQVLDVKKVDGKFIVGLAINVEEYQKED